MMYLNVQRAALRLGVAPHTVRRWTASGLLPCTRTPGGHRRIRDEDVDALARRIGDGDHLAARRAREREVDTLLETSLALVSRLELTDLLKEIGKRLTCLMDCHFCAISTYDEQTQTVTMLADFDAGGRRLADRQTYGLARFPLTRHVLEERITAVVNLSDPTADQHEVRELAREGDRSLLMAPLVYSGRSIGLLELIDHSRERRYSHQDLRICQAIAGQAAVALHNAQTYAQAGIAVGEAEDMTAVIDAVGEEVAAFATAANEDELLEAAAAAACRVFAAACCVAATETRSAGATGPPDATASDESAIGRDAPGSRRLRTYPDTEVITARDTSGPAELTLTLSLPRPARRGEPQILGLLAAAASGHLARLRRREEP